MIFTPGDEPKKMTYVNRPNRTITRDVGTHCEVGSDQN